MSLSIQDNFGGFFALLKLSRLVAWAKSTRQHGDPVLRVSGPREGGDGGGWCAVEKPVE